MGTLKKMTEGDHLRAAELTRQLCTAAEELLLLIAPYTPKKDYLYRTLNSLARSKLVTFRSEMENRAFKDNVVPDRLFPHYRDDDVKAWRKQYGRDTVRTKAQRNQESAERKDVGVGEEHR